MTLAAALRQGTKSLEHHSIHAPAFTAELLLLHAIRSERAVLRAHPERELTPSQQVHYARYLHERISGIPTQYIMGHQEFWGLDLQVNPSVLIPRPETEHVVERVITLAGSTPGLRIVDCGTGSGCIALALAHDMPTARLFATDLSHAALLTAARNAQRVGLSARVNFLQADLLSCFADESLDMVASNPPYVAESDTASLATEVRDHEPAAALFAGPDGGAIYRRLVPQAVRVIRPGGWLVLELGYNMGGKVRDLFAPEVWESVSSDPDLAGIERVMYARRRSP